MKKTQSQYAERGSSLAESMVALGLVVVGLLGIVTLYTRSSVLNREVVHETIAAGLAAEGIEVVKHLIDIQIAGGGEWPVMSGVFEIQYDSTTPIPLASGQTKSTRQLHFNETKGPYTYDLSETLTPFRRTVTVENVTSPGPGVLVAVRVEWEERGETKSLTVEDRFFNWRRS